MLKTENIKDGQIIIMTLGFEGPMVGIIKNVANAITSGNRSEGSNPDELSYDIFVPQINKTKEGICQHSGVTTDAEALEGEEVELLLLQTINEFEDEILQRRNAIYWIRSAFKDNFKKGLTV